jgi:uncharacterized protein with FMN-binding domain
MKKLLLPLAVVAASTVYVWSQQARIGAENAALAEASIAPAADVAPVPSASSEPSAPVIERAIAAPLPELAEPGTIGGNDGDEDEDDRPATPVAPAKAKPQLPPVAIVQASAQPPANGGGLADGTYKGPAANAYYGLVQVQATIENGRLAKIGILSYPSDRRTSRYINGQALPMLEQEAISQQTADVDFITGATLTSEAFVQSLGGALAKAR